MIRTFYVFAFVLTVSALTASAQTTDPQFSLYMFNPVYYNPGAAGSEGVSRFQLTHRTQYAGYQPTVIDEGGGQSTQLFSFNVPLAKIKGGLGIYAFNDRFGPTTSQAVQISYAYRLALKNGTLSLGVQGGLLNLGFDNSQYRPGEPGDPSIPTARINQARPDVGVGVYYNTTDYWVGVSAKHLNQPRYSLVTDQSIEPAYRTLFLTAGYRLGVGYNLDVQPSVLVQYATPVAGGTTVNVNLLATYDNRFFGGLSYRLQDALTAMLGVHLLPNNALRFGYAFDFVVGSQDAKSPTSHEVQLAYSLPAPDARKRPIIRTPRFRY